MVTIGALWLPILVASVFVFFASFVMHTVLPFHKKDWGKLGKEDDVMEALRGMDVQPGQYVFPHMTDPAQLKDEAFLARMTRGPVAFLTVIPSGPPNMGMALGLYRLLPRDQRGRRLPDGAHAVGRRRLPRRVPRCRDGRVPGVFGRSGASRHLEGCVVESHVARDRRRIGLLVADRRGLRLALAVTGAAARTARRRLPSL